LIGPAVDRLQRPSGQHPHGQRRRKGIARADGILDNDGFARIIGPLAPGIKQAAVRAAGQADQALGALSRQLLDLPARAPAQAQHCRQYRQFGIVAFHDVGQAQRCFNDVPREIMLAQVEVQNPQRPGANRRQQRLNRPARRLAPLPQRAETHRVRFGGGGQGRRFQGQAVPGNILVNGEARLAAGQKLHADRSRRGGRVRLDIRGRQAQSFEPLQNFRAQRVPAHTRDHAAPRAEAARVKGKIRRRAAQLFAGGQEVPENLSDADDVEVHGDNQ